MAAVLALALLAPRCALAVSGCNILAFTGLSFPDYDPVGTNRTAPDPVVGTITFSCTGGAAQQVYVELDSGQSSASIYTRRMASGAYSLNYNVYVDASHVTVWGDGKSGYHYGRVQNDQAFNATVYGQIASATVADSSAAANPNAAVGTYSDTIQLALTWKNGAVTQSYPVTVNVKPTCSISAVPLAFGGYDPVAANASAPRDAAGGVTVACTAGTVAAVGLDLGQHASGAQRQMSDGASAYLKYDLYSDSARTKPWGSSGTGLLSLPPPADQSQRTFPVYGRIPAGQDASVGSYSDVVTATCNF